MPTVTPIGMSRFFSFSFRAASALRSCGATSPRAGSSVGSHPHPVSAQRTSLWPKLCIGMSGWRYEPWRGVVYPKGLPQQPELAYCARHFPTVEINGSFYSLQRPEFYRQWYDAAPPGFVYAVKGSRYITHMLKLR